MCGEKGQSAGETTIKEHTKRPELEDVFFFFFLSRTKKMNTQGVEGEMAEETTHPDPWSYSVAQDNTAKRSAAAGDDALEQSTTPPTQHLLLLYIHTSILLLTPEPSPCFFLGAFLAFLLEVSSEPFPASSLSTSDPPSCGKQIV